MKRFVKPAAVVTAALVLGLVLAPSARAQYRSYYYSSSATTFTPPPGIPEPPGPTPVVIYGSGIGVPVNFGTSRSVFYAPGYSTYYRSQNTVFTLPPTETSTYFTPTFGNRPSYTYTPGYYSYYYTPAYYTPTTSAATRYYRD